MSKPSESATDQGPLFVYSEPEALFRVGPVHGGILARASGKACTIATVTCQVAS